MTESQRESLASTTADAKCGQSECSTSTEQHLPADTNEDTRSNQTDYLALWIHYEGRGYDDKNRMIASTSLLLAISGVFFAAAVTVVTANQTHTDVALVLSIFSLGFALFSFLLVGSFCGHAARNFASSDLLWSIEKPGRFAQNVSAALADAKTAGRNAKVHWHPGAWTWFSGGKLIGYIFLYFSIISLLTAAVPLWLIVSIVNPHWLLSNCGERCIFPLHTVQVREAGTPPSQEGDTSTR